MKSTSLQLVMICPTMTDLGGHEYDYTKDVAQAAIQSGAGVETILPTNAAGMEALPGRSNPCLAPYGYPPSPAARVSQATRRFLRYCRVFCGHKDVPTLWFVHSAPQNELAIISFAWIITGHFRHNLSLFLRHDIGRSHMKGALVRLLRFVSEKKVFFVSDSDTLVETLSNRLKRHVSLVPIPVTLPTTVARDSKQIVCGYFGARRRVKGFTLLPSLAEALHHYAPSAQFVVQAYKHRDEVPDVEIEDALGALRLRKNVRLIETSLDSGAFGRELAACHAVFIPYDNVNYKDATSGIFVMAVVARAVVIVTDQNWMSRQTQKFGLTRVVLMPNNPTAEQINLALEQALEILRRPDAPSDRERLWCGAQSAPNLWRILKTATGMSTPSESSGRAC